MTPTHYLHKCSNEPLVLEPGGLPCRKGKLSKLCDCSSISRCVCNLFLPAGSVFETGRHKVTCFDTQSRSTSCSITHAGSLHLEQTMLPATPVSPLQLSEVHQRLELANVLHQLCHSQAPMTKPDLLCHCTASVR